MSEITEKPFNRISKQLEDYLDKKTNNAILLTASWGAGKTHYLKNIFFNIIKEKGYKKVYVSLFGANSIDDIKERIFIELYPFLDNKALKVGTTIFKALFKSIDNLEEAGAAIKTYKKESIDLGKLVICFDDLERAKPELIAENQILGYINSLVEDDNIKVIIIANEPKVIDEHFKKVKEKVIANTIHFSQEFNEAFESILEALSAEETSNYIEHLKSSAPIIHHFLTIENGENINYRTLSYFLAYYEPIWRSIQIGTGISDLDEKRTEILDYLLKFVLFICVEYKKGTITFRKPAGLDIAMDLHVKKFLDEKLETSENTVDQLIKSYFQKDDYIFYRSIFNYITGGDYFNSAVLIQELRTNYRVQDQNISPSYKIFNTLSAIRYNQLSDQQYIKLIRELKKHALKGNFLLQDFPAVFYYIFRYGNVLNLNAETFAEEFCKVINKTAKWQSYNRVLDRYLSNSKENEHYEQYEKLHKVIKTVNLKAKQREQEEKCHRVEQRLLNDFDKFYKEIIAEYQAKRGMTITLCGTRTSIFFQVFKKATNKQKNEMINIIRILFEHYFEEKVDEKFYLQELQMLNSKYLIKYNPKNISGDLHQQLDDNLVEFITMRK